MALESLIALSEEGARTALRSMLVDERRPHLVSRSLEACYRYGLAGCLPDKGALLETVLRLFPAMKSDDQRRAATALIDRLATELADHLRQLDVRQLSRLSESLDSSGPAKETGLMLVILRELSSRREGTSITSFASFWESEFIFDSGQAIAQRQMALEHLLSKEIPAAAEAIAEAASHGDLSENAEYTAALERRDLLLARGKEWKQELGRMRPYPEGDISPKVASPGTRISLREDSADGKTVLYELVGPLSSDPTKARINYMAPLGAVLLGKAPGDFVAFPSAPGREYIIETIEVLPEVRSGR